MMEVRERCRQTLTAAAQSGKLRVSMEQLATERRSYSPVAEQIKEQARTELLSAVESGNLGGILASIRDEADRDEQLTRDTMVLARNELACAARSGRLDDILESVKQDDLRERRESMSITDMQAVLASQLSFAAETGALTQILRTVSTHNPEPSRAAPVPSRAAPEPSRAAEADMEDIRCRIQHCFTDSCRNGSFASALRDVQQDELRADAKVGRTPAPDQGFDVDAMRSRLQKTFHGAIAEGTMDGALQACLIARVRSGDMSHIRDIESSVRQALEAAAEDGTLSSLLQQARDEQHDACAGAAAGATDAGDAAAATAGPSEARATGGGATGGRSAEPGRPIRITILGARNLYKADVGKDSDPYCVCEVPGRPGSRFQTPVLDSTLNPVWNHEVTMADYKPGDPLRFSVWDKDPGANPDDPLGRCCVGSARFNGRGFDGELPLTGKGTKGVNARIRLRILPVEEVDAAVVRIQSIQRGRCARREAARVQREQHAADAGGPAAEEAQGASGEPDVEAFDSLREQVWSGMQECFQSGRLEEWIKSRPSSRDNAAAAAKAPEPPAAEELVPAQPGADAWALFQLLSNSNRRIGLLQATIRDVEQRIEATTACEEQLRADLKARREESQSLEAEVVDRHRALMEQEGLHWKLRDKKRKLVDKISLENLQHKYDAELDTLRSQSTVATLRDQDLRGPTLAAGGAELLT